MEKMAAVKGLKHANIDCRWHLIYKCLEQAILGYEAMIAWSGNSSSDILFLVLSYTCRLIQFIENKKLTTDLITTNPKSSPLNPESERWLDNAAISHSSNSPYLIREACSTNLTGLIMLQVAEFHPTNHPHKVSIEQPHQTMDGIFGGLRTQ